MLSIGFENVSAKSFVIAAAVTFGLLVLLGVVLRRLKNSKVSLMGDRGRARQPRLGIVDVYDLDRQRQLILLRRDNVEHLLLVGGPNDVVVETNIVRAPGARLPAQPEAADPTPDRNGESTPARPVIEAISSPAPEALPSGPANDAGPPVVAGRPPVVGRIGGSPTRSAPTSLPAPDPRGGERSRATPAPPPGLVAARAAASRIAGAGAGPGTAGPSAANPAGGARGQTAEGARDSSAGDRAVLSGMARELEDVLKRPPENRPRRGPEPARMPTAAMPARLEGGNPAARPATIRGRTETSPSAPARAEPDKPEPALEAPASTPPAATEPTPVAADLHSAPGSAAAPASPREDAASPAAPEPKPAEDVPTQAASLDGSPPVQPPPEGQPSPSPPPITAQPQPERPQPTPEPATSSRSDPFSIEDIEAEFARLLGRPLDRRDRS